MTSERQELLRRLFDEASSFDQVAQAAFLESRSEVDPALLDELRELLACVKDDDPLDRPDHFADPDLFPPGEDPETIDEYRISERLGEGGMGVVYRAQQEQGMHREVALKVMRAIATDPGATMRFKGEIDALARMQHSNIAVVYGAGSAEDGSPYFTMECVPGRSIDDHCDELRLSLRERLKLFVDVCHGVQHAHQKKVIHRDIKPSNVLVTIQDGIAVPKLIDFGIAQSVGSASPQGGHDADSISPAETREATGLQASVRQRRIEGSPCYMSPEQTLGDQTKVDTRTDVYSLGVLLYELLVGSLPLPRELFDEQPDTSQQLALIREVVPETPSVRLLGLGDAAGGIAAMRSMKLRTLIANLRDDLDWVVMRALEKNAEQRFASASDLAAEILRFLNNEPLNSRPSSALYRVRKFSRRHRLAVVASLLVLAALLGGVAGTTTGMMRARYSERTATGVAEFIENAIMEATPEVSGGQDVTVRQMLDKQAPQVLSLESTPEARARIMRIMGQAYRRLHVYDDAKDLLDSALLESPTESDLIKIHNELGSVLLKQGHHVEALPYYEKALALVEDLNGPEHEDLAGPLANLAEIYLRSGDLARAHAACERSLAIREGMSQADGELAGVEIAKSLVVCGKILHRSGESEAAVRVLERALALRIRHVEKFGDLKVGYAHFFLGNTLYDIGRFEESRAHLSAAHEIWARNYGPRDGHVGQVSADLARAFHKTGDDARADELFRVSIAIEKALYETASPEYVAERHEEYAAFLRAVNRYEEAVEQEERAARVRHDMSP